LHSKYITFDQLWHITRFTHHYALPFHIFHSSFYLHITYYVTPHFTNRTYITAWSTGHSSEFYAQLGEVSLELLIYSNDYYTQYLELYVHSTESPKLII